MVGMTHQDRVVGDADGTAAGVTGRDVLDAIGATDGVVGFPGAVTLDAALRGVVSKFRATIERKC